MGAVIDSIKTLFSLEQLPPHTLVQELKIELREKPLGYCPLVRHQHSKKPSSADSSHGFRAVREKPNLIPSGNVLSLGQFSVDYAIAIKKDCSSHRRSLSRLTPR